LTTGCAHITLCSFYDFTADYASLDTPLRAMRLRERRAMMLMLPRAAVPRVRAMFTRRYAA